jgi:hypothetical protein
MFRHRDVRAERVPLVVPTMRSIPLPDTRLFQSRDLLVWFGDLLDEIKQRVTSLPSDPKTMAHATADRLADAWYPFHPERVDLLVQLFMFAAHGAAAKVVEGERFGIERGLVALPISAALASMHLGIGDLIEELGAKGVEPTTWKLRNGYAVLAGYYATRVQGTDVLDLLVANSEDDFD